jgi:hypothetical protein
MPRVFAVATAFVMSTGEAEHPIRHFDAVNPWLWFLGRWFNLATKSTAPFQLRNLFVPST